MTGTEFCSFTVTGTRLHSFRSPTRHPRSTPLSPVTSLLRSNCWTSATPWSHPPTRTRVGPCQRRRKTSLIPSRQPLRRSAANRRWCSPTGRRWVGWSPLSSPNPPVTSSTEPCRPVGSSPGGPTSTTTSSTEPMRSISSWLTGPSRSPATERKAKPSQRAELCRLRSMRPRPRTPLRHAPGLLWPRRSSSWIRPTWKASSASSRRLGSI